MNIPVLSGIVMTVFSLTSCSGLGVSQDVMIRNRLSNAVMSPRPSQMISPSPSTKPLTQPRNVSPTPAQPQISAQPVPLATATADPLPEDEQPIKASVIIELQQLKLKEIRGNNDNEISRGESIRVQPVLLNTGNSRSNPLSLRLSSLDPDIKITRNSYSIQPIHPQEMSSQEGGFELEVSKETPSKKIPINIVASDEFGNSWKLQEVIEVKEINNKISIASFETASVNQYNNLGELIRVQTKISKLSISNTGKSDTNHLSVRFEGKNGASVWGSYISYLNFGKIYSESIDSADASVLSRFNINFEDQEGEVNIIVNDDFGNEWEFTKRVQRNTANNE